MRSSKGACYEKLAEICFVDRDRDHCFAADRIPWTKRLEQGFPAFYFAVFICFIIFITNCSQNY